MKLFKKYYIDWFPLLLFLMAFVLWRGSFYQVSLYLLIPILIVVTFSKNYRTITQCIYYRPYLLLLLWALLSSLINDYTADSLRKMIPIFASFLLSVSAYSIALKKNNSTFLYFAYFVFFVVIMMQTFQQSGFVQDFNYANEAEREETTKMNANEYAYYSFFLIIAVRMMLEWLGMTKTRYLLLLIYLVLTVVVVYVALLTASRQVLYIEIPLLAFLLYMDFFKNNKKGGTKVLFLIMIIGILLAMIPVFMFYFDNSYLAVRSEVSYQDDSRSTLLVEAMELAFMHPLFGIGLAHPIGVMVDGIPVYFSHCTYTHLASRCGLLSLILYLYIGIKYLSTQYKHYRLYKDTTYLLFFMFGVFYFIGNFLYNYIDGPFMMAILFILIGDSERYYMNQTRCIRVH